MVLLLSLVQRREASQYYQIVESLFNPLPDDKIVDWSKLKQIADDILKCI